jgi:hypothetical protein
MEIKTKTIVINEIILQTLLRLKCPENIIWNYIKTGEIERTDDELINEYLENLIFWEV